jgi:hypothetical protein
MYICGNAGFADRRISQLLRNHFKQDPQILPVVSFRIRRARVILQRAF